MEKLTGPTGRLGQVTGVACPRSGNALRYKVAWMLALFVGVLYFFFTQCEVNLTGNMLNMIGWKEVTLASSLVLGAVGQSMKVYNLSEIDWTVGNDALNVSVPGSLPSHVCSIGCPL